MPRDSLSNDTRDADEHNKPQSKTVTGGTVTDCGFRVSSMIQYATLPHRDYGAVSTSNQQQGAGIDRGDGVVTDGGEPASGEIERRIVQPSEYEDTLAEVETKLRGLDTDFARIRIEPVKRGEHNANEKFAALVDETDHCLNCGDDVDEGGFCDYDCFMKWGGSDE